jgi:hypothetical protein
MGNENIPLAGDILYHAKNIAAFMGCSVRFVYYLHANTNAPIFFRIGSTLCSRRSVIMAWIAAQESGHPFLAPQMSPTQSRDGKSDRPHQSGGA